MRFCVLDGKKITDKEILHDILKNELDLPDWYGRNLDALYDCLTEAAEDMEIVIKNKEVLECCLGRYAAGLWKVLRAAEQENQSLKVTVSMAGKSGDM